MAYVLSIWPPDKLSLFQFLFLQLFADTYPDEEFLPRKSSPKYAECDSDSAE